MKNYEVTIYATIRKVVAVRAIDGDDAIETAVNDLDTSDLLDWDILELSVDDYEEHHEED